MGLGSQYSKYQRMAPGGSFISERAGVKSGALYQKLFQTNLYPMVLTKIDGRFIDVNEAFLNYTGYKKEELIGRRCSDLQLWEPNATWERLQRKLSRFGALRDYDLILLSKRGEKYLALLSAEMIEAEDGRYILVIISQLRERKEESGKENGREELAALIERLKAELAEAVSSGKLEQNTWTLSGIGHWGVAVLDSRNRIILANQNYSALLGYRPEELIGKHFTEISDRDGLVLEEAIESVIMGPQSTISYEKKYVDQKGEVFWGRLHICSVEAERKRASYKLILREDLTLAKKRDLTPRVQQRIYRSIIGVITESILQMVRYEEEEAASLQKFGVMVSERLLPLASQLIGAEKGICYGYTRQGDCISFYGSNRISEEEADRLKDKLRGVWERHKGVLNIMLRTKRPVYISHQGYPGDWEQFAPEQGSYFLIPLCYGKKVIGFYCLTSPGIDGFKGDRQLIAESLGDYLSLAMENARLFSETARLYHRRNKAREEDFKAQKMNAVGTLAGGMAHELNNQLSIIYACVDLSIHHVPRNSALHRNILKIQGAAYKSANITRQLLLFGNKQPQFKVILNINRLLSELRSLLERIAGESRILSYDLASDLWLTYADAANIEQVVINLVLNARDAMPEGGRIMVATGNTVLGQSRAKAWGVTPGRYISITINDTGCGIRREDIQHIFDPFFTTKEQGSGTGLGLSVAYGIVKAHHGRISVRSKPGKGSSFEIYLPVAED